MADSSHNDYCVDDVWDDYCVDTDVVVVLVDIDIDVGPPGAARHRTPLASPNTLDLVYWPAGSPWSPFDAQPLFAVWNHMGIYVFGKRMPPEEIQAQVFSAEATLLSLSPITYAATPIGANLLGSVGSGQRPTGTATLRNNGEWNSRVESEIWMTMGAGSFLNIRGLFIVPRLVGSVGRITLSEDVVTISYGAFKRDVPAGPIRFI